MPKFSIIVPVYNVSRFLDKCIQSVLAQSFCDYELILVDDGSTDESGVICDIYAEADSRIIVIHKTNGGLSDARNAGLEIAKGEYYYFLDSDDYISEQLLEKTIAVFEQRKTDMVVFGYTKVSEKGEVLSEAKFINKEFCIGEEHEKFKYFVHVLFQYGQGWEAWDRVYRGDIIRQKNLRFVDNDKIYAEDLLFLMMYLMNAKSVIGLKDALHYYLIRETSIMGVKGKQYNAMEIEALAEYFYSYAEKEKKNGLFVDRFYYILGILLYNEAQHKSAEQIELGMQKVREKEFVRKQIEKLFDNADFLQKDLGVAYTQELLDFCGKLYGHSWKYKRPSIIERIHYKLFVGGLRTYLHYWHKSRNIFIIGSEDAGNLGDHQIAVSMREFFAYYFPKYGIVEWPASNYKQELEEKGKYIRKRDWICTPGGGNLGDVYPYSESIRRCVIERFSQNKIIIFPQTVFFTDTEHGKKEKEITKNIYQKHKKLKLLARDENSYKRAQEIYNGESALVPDIVLFSDYRPVAENKREGVLLCLRSDIESNLTFEDKKKIETVVSLYEKNYKYMDHQYAYDIPLEQREKNLAEIMGEYQNARLVVTDRLHGMIFAAVTGTPCVALDNYNQKISGVFQWIRDLPYIDLCSNIEEVGKSVKKVLATENASREIPREKLQVQFDEMAKMIRK